MTAAAATRKPESITLEQFADIFGDSRVEHEVDLGNAIVYRVQHARFGPMVLVNNPDGCCAQVPI